MKFKARVYSMNKGKGRYSYFATIRQGELVLLKLKESRAFLLKINNQIFPTVITKLRTTKDRFMYGFSIPQTIGKDLQIKSDIDFEFLATNLNQKIRENSKELCLPNILPQKTIRDKNFYAFDLDDKILIWIYSTGNGWYILPKYISLAKNGYDLLELFGGYFCEGFKARKQRIHLDRLSYSSSEIGQIEWFISSMESLFEIKNSEWHAQILVRNYNKQNYNYLIKHWTETGLEKEKIKIINNGIVNDKFGVCLVNIYNSTLAETIYELSQHCKLMALKSKQNSLEFFRGLSRGDLGVTIGNTGNTLSFTNKYRNNIVYFKEICNNLNIKTGKIVEDKRANKECWMVFIHDFNSFKTIVNLNGIAHQRRKFYFYSKFLKCRGCTPFKYLKAVYRGYDTNQKISDHLKLSPVNVRAILLKYRKNKLLNTQIKTTGGKYKRHYSLSKKGKKLLEFYQNIESEIKDNNI